jgi:hypothetical protein
VSSPVAHAAYKGNCACDLDLVAGVLMIQFCINSSVFHASGICHGILTFFFDLYVGMK